MTLVVKNTRKLEFDKDRVLRKIDKFANGLNLDKNTLDKYKRGVVNQISAQAEIDFRNLNNILIMNSLDYIMDFKQEDGSMDFDKLGNTDFQYLAGRVLLNSLYKRAAKNRSFDVSNRYGDFYGLLSSLGEMGLVDKSMFTAFTKEEVQELGKYIKPDRDNLLTYSGIYNMAERYLIRAKDENRSVYELPQERYMIISMFVLHLEEKENRIQHIKDLYDELSNQRITMATPTFANAGRPGAQLSSCFILTTDDSLRGIYDDNTDAATLSKAGGGIGIYTGFIRSAGSDIKGNVGVAGGLIPWLKQLNNTAVGVNQLGIRNGAIAAYLDVWHADIEDFLELRLNTGDLAKRAHELFLGVTIPDVFMRKVEARGDWYLFDPHELKTKLGYQLQDFYDEEIWDGKSTPDREKNAFTYRYFKAVDTHGLRSKKRVAAIEIMKKIMRSHLEVGMPYMFYRDTVNRDNPNKHSGVIYSSNLCSEILQNQSPTTVSEEYIDSLGKITITKDSGDFVVCNLSSLVINNAVNPSIFSGDKDALAALEKTIQVQTRATDSVIDVNSLPVPQAEFTNSKYRAIGLGEQGIAALLANMNIPFDSVMATEKIAELEELIMLLSIKASAKLGKEKGSYPLFEGSEWNTGAWIEKRLDTVKYRDEWALVQEQAQESMRNAYLRAVAPTGSTSLLSGSTAAADTVYDAIFFDGKKDSKTPVVAPNLSLDTWFYYKPTMLMEYEGTVDLGHMWAIKHNEQRQKFVDQATSFNIYILDNISAVNLLRLHTEVWKRGIKTSYYTRSHDASKVDNCVACSS